MVERPDERGNPAPSPRLSVLLPAWNAASTIERGLASVLDQADVDLECVVVDDGSTDGTPDLVAAIAARDPRVVLVRLETNAGVSNARNAGLDVVSGEWLTFLDADDRLLPGGLAALMRATRDPAVRAVVGQRVWSDGERRWISPFYDIPDIREPGRKSIVSAPGLLYYVSGHAKAFHRSLLGGLRFEGRVLGDQPWIIRALLRAGDGIEVIGDDVYEWNRPHPDRLVDTITIVTRASADRSAESARIARGAFLQVAAEVDARVADPADRLAVKRAYAERLVRSDFAAALRTAVERADPGSAGLFDALAELLSTFPPGTMPETGVVVRSLLRPPWQRWRGLSPVARRAYWRMVEPVRRADPSVDGRLAGRRLAPAVRLARRLTAVHPALSHPVVGAANRFFRARRASRPA